MGLKNILSDDLHKAIREKNDIRKRILRMAISNIKLSEIEKRNILDDDAIIALLYKEIKNRKETIEEARKGNRQAIIDESENEIKILEEYLPKPLTEQELSELAHSVIRDLGVTSIKEMGLVMKELIAKVGCRASSESISRTVREILNSK